MQSLNVETMIYAAIGFIVLFVLYNVYANVIKNANKARESLSSIDVQLTKRSDLIPNILKIAKKFLEHEMGLMQEITELRSQAQGAKSGSKEKFQIENTLKDKMGSLMVQVENYPELKSDATMIQAMQTYNEVEEHIAAARRFYNASLTELKNSTQIFPGSLFAGFAGDTLSFQFYEADAKSKAPVDAGAYL